MEHKNNDEKQIFKIMQDYAASMGLDIKLMVAASDNFNGTAHVDATLEEMMESVGVIVESLVRNYAEEQEITLEVAKEFMFEHMRIRIKAKAQSKEKANAQNPYN